MVGGSLLEPLLMRKLGKAAELYHAGAYDKVLWMYQRALVPKACSTVYGNVFRILSLMQSGQDEWESEYLTLKKFKDLDMLGVTDKTYIQTYMARVLGVPDDDEFMTLTHDDAKVSRSTRAFFPMVELSTVHIDYFGFSQTNLNA